MTGVEQWAKSANTTAREITMLIAAENPTGYTDFLGPSLKSEDPIPSGRDTALRGMLERGRAGQIKVPFQVIAQLACCPTEIAFKAMQETCSGAIMEMPVEDSDTPISALNSAALPALLAEIDRRMNRPVELEIPTPAQAAQPQAANPMTPPPAAQAAPAQSKSAGVMNKPGKAPARRKTKYSVSKNQISEMLKSGDGTMPVREVRAFLLSLPDYKPQDVALMSDADVMEIFGGGYVAVKLGSGVVVMPPDGYDILVGLLSAPDTYYIPAAAPPVAEPKGE